MFLANITILELTVTVTVTGFVLLGQNINVKPTSVFIQHTQVDGFWFFISCALTVSFTSESGLYPASLYTAFINMLLTFSFPIGPSCEKAKFPFNFWFIETVR